MSMSPSIRESDILQATVLVDVAVVLLAGLALLRFSRLARQPAVTAEILAGIALGPSLLGLLPGHLSKHIFPTSAAPLLSAVAQIGLLLFMFMLGWELDAGQLRGSRRSVTAVAAGSMLLPFALGLGAAFLCYSGYSKSGSAQVRFLPFALYVGVAMSVTAFPVLARILSDSGLERTRVGALALSAAALTDVVAWCLLAIVVGLATNSGAAGGFTAVVLWSLGFVAALALIVRPLYKRLISRLINDHPAQLTTLIAAGVFLSGCATEMIGVHPIFGAFMFGLMLPREPWQELKLIVLRPLQDTARLLLPVYFIIVGLSVNIGALHGPDWAVLALLLCVACVGKLVGATVPARLTGFAWRESIGIGFLMNTRGLTELIILNVGLSTGVLNQRLFTLMVLVALITTALAGPLLPSLIKKPASAAPATSTAAREPHTIAQPRQTESDGLREATAGSDAASGSQAYS
jgi:Kef-type K+ transport system membrane component KefB